MNGALPVDDAATDIIAGTNINRAIDMIIMHFIYGLCWMYFE